MNIRTIILTSMALALASGLSSAQDKEPTLRVGDSAPKLQVAKWVQGQPAKEFDRDHAYIVEFWATWCGPCRISIPHLNELWEKFKDKNLIVIGQDVWEKDESAVEPFIKKMGDKMTYRVALDDKSSDDKGAMSTTWMAAAGRSGIPSAFLVDKQGKIAWIGHPMSLTETQIEEVLAGKHDLKKAAADYAAKEKEQGELKRINRDLSTAMQAKDWDKATAALDEIAKITPKEQSSYLDMMRLRIMVGKGDDAGAVKLANRLADSNSTNAPFQMQLAYVLTSQNTNIAPILEAAAKAATSANELTKGTNPVCLTVLARVNHLQGNKAKAIEFQEKALKLTENEQQKTYYARQLDTYKGVEKPAEKTKSE